MRVTFTNWAASAWTSWTRGSLKEVAVLLAKKRLLTSHTCACRARVASAGAATAWVARVASAGSARAVAARAGVARAGVEAVRAVAARAVAARVVAVRAEGS